MIKIRIDNTNYNIPSEWCDVKLSSYEKWFDSEIQNKEDEVAFVSKITGIGLDVLKTFPVSFYNDLVQMIGFSFKDAKYESKNSITIDNINYSINSEEELTLAEYVDVEAVLQGNDNRLSSVLAIVCRPIGEKYDTKNLPERIKLFNNLTMDKLFPLFTFFLNLKEQSDKIMKLCLAVQETTDQLHLHTEASLKNGVGTTKLWKWRMIIYKKWIRFYQKVLLKFSISYPTK